MGMMLNGKGGAFAEMNVVPLIDILLVLLVIFMIIPHHQYGLEAQIPQPADPPAARQVEPEVIVVQVLMDGSLKINQEPVTWEALQPRLQEIYRERVNKVAFVRGDEPLEFQVVARVIDVMHGSGISVGLLTPKLDQSR